MAATSGLELTATRSVLPFFLPLAAIGIVVAILLDNGTATIVVALMSGLAAVVVGSVEVGFFTLLGGLAGVIAVRRGERVQQFGEASGGAAKAEFQVRLHLIEEFTPGAGVKRGALGEG